MSCSSQLSSRTDSATHCIHAFSIAIMCVACLPLQGVTAVLAAVLLSQDAFAEGSARTLLKVGLFLGPFAFAMAQIASGVSGM